MVIEDIDLTTCRQINERLGVAAIADAPVTLPATCDYAAFTGTYPATGTITVTGKLGRTAGVRAWYRHGGRFIPEQIPFLSGVAGALGRLAPYRPGGRVFDDDAHGSQFRANIIRAFEIFIFFRLRALGQ
jgi:hypothetical protein